MPRLEKLRDELEFILTSQKLQLTELFHKVAVRCNDFIRFCEVHRRFLMPGNEMGRKSCCEQIFNQVPIFTTLGTCYTTNAAIWESYPFTFSNIKVWLDVRTSNSPGCSTTKLEFLQILVIKSSFHFSLPVCLQGLRRHGSRRRVLRHKSSGLPSFCFNAVS